MADPIDFLSTLFAALPDDSIKMASADEDVTVSTAEEINNFLAANEGGIGVCAETPEDNVAFYHTLVENMQPDEWQDMTLRPTVVLNCEHETYLYYALEAPVKGAEFSERFWAAGCALSEYVPLPGTPNSYWTLLHYDPEIYYPVETILASFGPDSAAVSAVADAPPWEGEDFGTFGDARLLSELELDDPYYNVPIVIATGRNAMSTDWKNDESMTVAKLVTVLSRHPEGKTKDGLSFVLAKIIGKRRIATAIEACYAIGLDIDVGMPGVEVDEALRKLGCLAVRYTTFSHRKTESKFNKDKITKWLKKNKLPTTLTTESVRTFLREESKWDRRILESAVYVGDRHEEQGIHAIVEHAPMEKHRIVVPLEEPFRPSEAGTDTHREGIAVWGKICKALARFMGDLPMDNSATDPSRLFYFPRHAAGAPHETTIHGGPLLNYKSLALDEAPVAPASWEEALAQEVTKPETGKGKSKSQTEAGRKLGRWSMKSGHGFQVADVIRDHAPEKIRADGATKMDIECPFDEDHSDPGNPDDRGCFAVNAGDGVSDFFTIRCQHDSCHGKTGLDFLGKMITDGWFGEEVLEDPVYNAAAPEESATPSESVKIAVQDDARAEYEKLIDNLTADSTDDEIDEAIRAYLQADLTGRAAQRAEADIKKKVGLTQANLTRILKSMRAKINQESNQNGDIKDPKGRSVFSFQGEFHFDEAFDMCFESLKRTNRANGEPTFSCVQDKPVRLSRDALTGRISFEELTNRTLWSELNNRVTFVRRNDNNDGSRAPVPREVADHVYEQLYTEVTQSPEVIYTPLFTATGDLIVQPGYYEELNILMANTGFEVEVPIQPTADEVEEAVRFLTQELLVDFPFLDYDTDGIERREPSEANALAMLITPFMRRMIKGVTPVFFVAKPTPGTGGTMLGRLPMLIFDGEDSAPMRYSQNEEEMQKALLAAIIETRSHLFFDDVKEFNNRVLLQSLTSTKIAGRVLGSTRNVSRPNMFGWTATGNNPFIGAEMDRRICWIRLNRKAADIQTINYTHKDFPGWIAENRAKIVNCILTLIQYWIDIDCPLFTERKLVTFEDWGAKVGGVLQAAGIEGFLNNRRFSGGDMDETANKAFIREWLNRFGFESVSITNLFQHAIDLGLDIIDGNNDDQKKSRFPKRLHTLDGRVFLVEGVEYMVKTSFNSEGLTYGLLPLESSVVAA